MSATDNGFLDIRSASPFYHDLRSIQDDKRVLRNPHKGWYWHYIDNGYGRDNYRVEHDPADHCEDFPGLNHLYLRFDWGDIERSEGVYDWSYIDHIMDEWSAYDYRFAFRSCTYEGSPEGSLAFATPKWVFDAGAEYTIQQGGAYEPDYGDPIYLEKLENFLREDGRRFDGDPRVELVDIGSFGTWGEGHTGAGSGRTYPNEVIEKHIALHKKYFPNTFLMFNDDLLNHRSCSVSRADSQALLDYAVSLGLGARDDSVCVDYYCRHCGYNTLRTPDMFDRFQPQAPIDLEFEHYAGVLKKPDNWRGGLPFLDALMRTKATFAGFHGYPRPWLEKEPYLTEYIANRLGYWYFLDGIELPVIHKGENTLTLYFDNRGWSRAYHKYELRLRLVDTTGAEFDYTLDADNRDWQPGRTAVTAKIDADLVRGDYMLCLGLFEGGRPIELGISKEYYEPEGYYRLCKAVVE